MRLLLCVFLALLLVCCDPVSVHAEGRLHPRAVAPSLKNYRGDCRPGRDPADPNCCADRLAVCRIICKDDYAENGDMLYLKHCERECEAELRLCREGRR
ncbi:MAG: hypothetical protein KKA55_02325 [Proteobacteria bacterium]|nr:hypothetical protein [Pseudomonadota bacterium]MBU1594355.1 hypothetical protein [Pseudomonadota bacterium]